MVLGAFLGGAAGGATIQIVIQAVDKFSKEFKKVEKETKKTGKGFGGLGMSIKKLALPALAGVGVALGSFALASAKAAIAMGPIKRGFQDLAHDSENFLNVLNEATEGTISNFELMKSANNALLLGIDQKALPEMFKAAAIVGQAAGRTTTQAINDITVGIGRQSRLILDNLGIIVKADEAYKSFAEANKIVGRELTANEKRIAFTDAAMEGLRERQESLGGEMEKTLSFQLERLKKRFEDLKVTVGEELTPELEKAAGALNLLIDIFDILNDGTVQTEEQTSLLAQQFSFITDQFNETFKAIEEVVDVYKQVRAQYTEATDEIDEFTVSLKQSEIAFESMSGDIEFAENQLKDFRDELQHVNDEITRMTDKRFEGETAAQMDIAAKELQLKQAQREKLLLERGSEAFEAQNEVVQQLRNELEIMRLDSEIAWDSQRQQLALTQQQMEDTSVGVITNIGEWKQNVLDLTAEKLSLKNEIQFLSDKIRETKPERDKLKAELDKIKESADKDIESLKNLKTAIDNLKSKTITITTRHVTEGGGGSSRSVPGKQFGGLVGLDGPETVLVGEAGPEFVHPLSSPMTQSALGGMSGGIIVNIENVQGSDPEDIAEALEDKLQTLIST